MSDCNPQIKMRELFCNVLKTQKKVKTFNKPKDTMTKNELRRWATRNKYR